MHAQTLVRPENLAATKEEEEAFGKLPKSEQERLKRVAAKIHANTGHRNVEALAKQLDKWEHPWCLELPWKRCSVMVARKLREAIPHLWQP